MVKILFSRAKVSNKAKTEIPKIEPVNPVKRGRKPGKIPGVTFRPEPKQFEEFINDWAEKNPELISNDPAFDSNEEE